MLTIKSPTLVRVDTKNWLGNYNSTVVLFNNDRHMSNYLDKIIASHTSKLIGVHPFSTRPINWVDDFPGSRP